MIIIECRWLKQSVVLVVNISFRYQTPPPIVHGMISLAVFAGYSKDLMLLHATLNEIQKIIGYYQLLFIQCPIARHHDLFFFWHLSEIDPASIRQLHPSCRRTMKSLAYYLDSISAQVSTCTDSFSIVFNFILGFFLFRVQSVKNLLFVFRKLFHYMKISNRYKLVFFFIVDYCQLCIQVPIIQEVWQVMIGQPLDQSLLTIQKIVHEYPDNLCAWSLLCYVLLVSGKTLEARSCLLTTIFKGQCSMYLFSFIRIGMQNFFKRCKENNYCKQMLNDYAQTCMCDKIM